MPASDLAMEERTRICLPGGGFPESKTGRIHVGLPDGPARATSLASCVAAGAPRVMMDLFLGGGVLAFIHAYFSFIQLVYSFATKG